MTTSAKGNWYPMNTHFVMVGNKKYSRALEYTAQILSCAFIVYGVSITDEYKDRMMEIIARDVVDSIDGPGKISFMALPWGCNKNNEPLWDVFWSAYKGDVLDMCWVYAAGEASEGPSNTIVTSFKPHLIYPEQDDFENLVNKYKPAIKHAFVGAPISEILDGPEFDADSLDKNQFIFCPSKIRQGTVADFEGDFE